MLSRLKRPSASVTVVRSTAWLVLSSETSAPLTTAPSESFTVPLILPVEFWPNARTHARIVHKRAVIVFIRIEECTPRPKLLPAVVKRWGEGETRRRGDAGFHRVAASPLLPVLIN